MDSYDYDAYYRHADHGGAATGCSRPWEHCGVCGAENAKREAQYAAERAVREATPEYQAQVKEQAESARRFRALLKNVYSDRVQELKFGSVKL